MSKNTFLKSTIILTIATLTSKILGSIFRIPLQNIAGDEVFGIYSLVYPVYMVALTLSVAGIPVAISKLISEALVHKDHDKIYKIYRTATILTLLFGVASFVLIYSLSGPIANALGGQSTRLALIVVSATLLVAPYMAVYRGYFQGFQDMRPTAISQVLEQLIRVGFILGIAYILVAQNRTPEVISGGIMTASVLGALASLVFLLIFFKKSPQQPRKQSPYTVQDFKKMGGTILKISLPICVGAITMALINFVDSLTIPFSLKMAGVGEEAIHHQYGIYSRGLALVQIATVFSSSIILPLIPLITQRLEEKKMGETISIVERTHRMAHLISWPAAFGLFALTLPLNKGLFTNLEGSDVLAIIGISAVFTSLTLLGTGILQGMNKAGTAALIIIGAVMIKIITNLTFIKSYGLMGAGISTLVVYIFIFIANTYIIRKIIPFKIWKGETTIFVVASMIMAAIIGIPTLSFDIAAWSRTTAMIFATVAIIGGAAIYFTILFATKTIKREELAMLNLPKRGDLRKVKKILWGLLIVSLLLSMPGIVNRFQVEWENRTYEMVVPFEQIDELVINDVDLDHESILTRLKEAGLQGVSLEPETFQQLTNRGIVSVLTANEIKSLSLFDSELNELTLDKHGGIYVIVHENRNIVNNLPIIYADTEELTYKGRKIIYIPGDEKELVKAPIAYSLEKINLIEKAGLRPILRMPNVSKDEPPYFLQQAIEFADEKGIQRILFSGEEVLGAHDGKLIKDFLTPLKDAGYAIYQIEFTEQKGAQTAAYVMDMNVIRLHSITLGNESHSKNMEKAVRAVKERNIRTIFINFDKKLEPADSVESAETFISGVKNRMPSFFTLGEAQVFEKINIPKWSYLFTLISATLFVAIAALSVFSHVWLTLAAFAGLGLISLAAIVTDKLILLQGLALLVSVVAPIFAILPFNEKRNLFISYGRAIGITAIGICIVLGLLNGNEFLVKIEMFRGVILVYALPIAFMFLYSIWDNIKAILNASVKYIHLVILGIVGMIGIYYLMRTGNDAAVSNLELMFRQKLEDLLYVRPRTKEFLIGLPFYVLALYLLPIKRKLAVYISVIGIIGWLSIVNTFTHFHIPIYVSVLRTAYSLVLGLIIGFVFIFLYKQGEKLLNKHIKPRWFA